jgi:SAM-dependent MidA family methyltransferase
VGTRPEYRTPLAEILLERIRRQGPITFAQFMEACLYHPEHGYYTRQADTPGKGDYFTSPDLGPVFARLLARQFGEMWAALGRPSQFDLVECGAGRGRLAGQVLTAAQEQQEEFFNALRITLVETSPARRAAAQASLKRFGENVAVCEHLPAARVMGCVFSNELLDALPVHRVVARADGPREIYVAEHEGKLVEQEGELSSRAVADYLERYATPLAAGQLAEVHLAALAWLEHVAAVLHRGFLLMIDYGYRAHQLYGPGHLRGTLMAYRLHRAHEEWLAWPGEQDLTAHVNFTALETRGHELGLEALGLTTQTNFLLALARAGEFTDLGAADACDFDQMAVRLAFKQLIHPEGMGETFKVLVQAKGVADARLSGLEPL